MVGHCTLHLTVGDLGIASIQDVGVSTRVRRQGIGKSLMQAACDFARNLGCRFVKISPSDEGYHLYKRVGFRELDFTAWELYWLEADMLRKESHVA